MRRFSYDTAESTNRRAIDLAQSEQATPPFVVRAATQSAGRGRNGRSWASPPGGLWFSLAWPATQPLTDYEPLPLVVGDAVATTLDHTLGLTCALKWPNDVLVRQRKVAGILCQMELTPAPIVIIGIGLNANFSVTELPDDLRHPATTLQDELGHPVNLPALFSALIDTLESHLTQLGHAGFSAFATSIESRLAWRGKPVRLLRHETPEPLCGRLHGIDPRGRLVLDIADSTQIFSTGDITRLPH